MIRGHITSVHFILPKFFPQQLKFEGSDITLNRTTASDYLLAYLDE